MNERETKRKQLLQELARRFRDSANTLKHVAHRIDKASRTHEEMRQRMDAASAHLRECIEKKPSKIPFTYLEYVEFESAGEFEKFRQMDVITDTDIQGIDWDKLCNDLLKT